MNATYTYHIATDAAQQTIEARSADHAVSEFDAECDCRHLKFSVAAYKPLPGRISRQGACLCDQAISSSVELLSPTCPALAMCQRRESAAGSAGVWLQSEL